MVVAVGVILVFGGWFLVMVIWGLTGRPRPRTAGIGPFSRLVPLVDGESKRGELNAAAKLSSHIAYGGTLVFTDRRLIFAPYRNWDSPDSFSINYDDIAEWQIEKRRQLGIGRVVPFPRPALVLRTRGGERVFWPALGYDIEHKSKEALPPEKMRGS